MVNFLDCSRVKFAYLFPHMWYVHTFTHKNIYIHEYIHTFMHTYKHTYMIGVGKP